MHQRFSLKIINNVLFFQLEELEIENEKLKNDLAVLRDSLAMGDPGTKELLNQFRTSERELGEH